MGILKLNNLSMTVDGKTIIKNMTADFWEGHVHAIVGPNGAGKSTLAYTLMGLSGYKNLEGEIIYRDRVINALGVDERARLGITLAWQEPARFEGLSIGDFLKASAKEKTVDNIRKALELVDLDPEVYLKRAVDRKLSGGERKRVELASIFAMEPQLVLLDEPDSGIDVAALEKIFEMIKILKERGATVLLITHSVKVLQQADHAFLMCGGEIVDKGSVEKIGRYFSDKCLPCSHPNIPANEGLREVKI